MLDDLYKGPFGEFIAARTALERALRKQGQPDEAARVHALAKPSLAAWAVNQVYWHDRPVFEALVSAGDALRSIQRQRLAGRPQDPREAMRARQEAIRAAVATAARYVTDAGEPLTASTRQRIHTTFEAIASWGSADAPFTPGRLERELALPGFEALAALAAASPAPPLRLVKGGDKGKGKDEKAAPRAREADLRRQHASRQAEVRAAKQEMERATKAEAEAAAAERDAERALRTAERAAARARTDLERAQRAADTARSRAESAARALDDSRARHAETAAGVEAAARRLNDLAPTD